MLDGYQVAVYVITGEIRPAVESDHDPVGGYSSSVSLLDLKSWNIPRFASCSCQSGISSSSSGPLLLSYTARAGCMAGEN